MGIPSFYRHLCRKFPRLISRGTGPPPEWLCLDFNCAMYYVLRKMPPMATASSPVVWERDFCHAIAAYMEELIRLANPQKGVYVSCDGVVCAAKRRQQRLRRFKGPWMAAEEARVRAAAGGESICLDRQSGWDQNALTPGSAFMAQLGGVLVDAAARLKIPVHVSTTTEPGEGEHKLLRYMRVVCPASCTIYGLDADLILLAMLLGAETGADVRLMREAQEFERGGAAAEWRSLHVNGLVAHLLPGTARVPDFVAAMTLLGNDFLPRSLTHTVRDDGIPDLIRALQTSVWGQGSRLVREDGSLQPSALRSLITLWASTEEDDMRSAVIEAVKVSRRSTGDGDDAAVKAWAASPARWASLTRLLGDDRRTLRADWREIYRTQWHAGAAPSYLEGVAWTWEYYSGRPVDQGWAFDAHLPPLWSDVVAAIGDEVRAPRIQYPDPLPEWLHLFAVLPAESIARLLPPERQRLMAQAPWYWPAAWSLFDIGRTQMWECEPVIPMIPEPLLRSWVQR
jgi:5'-3' exonuclease